MNRLLRIATWSLLVLAFVTKSSAELVTAVGDISSTLSIVSVVDSSGSPVSKLDLLGNDSDPADENDPLEITSVDATGTHGLVTLIDGEVSCDSNGVFTLWFSDRPRSSMMIRAARPL